MTLRDLPKVELHRHLEGSVRPQTALELARRHGLPLPTGSLEELTRALQVLAPLDSLEQVLRVFDHLARLFVDLDAVERLAFEAVEDAALDGVRLLELRFSPDYMARGAALPWDGLVQAIAAGVARAQAQAPIAVGLVIIASRSLGVESARRTAEHAARWAHALVGFDLADDELGWPSHRFVEALAPLRGTGLGLTVHSGEAGGPEFVWDTLRSLSPQRLGHGVAVGADPALVAEVRDRGVCIEVCPTSNLRTRAVPSLAEHPARRLLAAGVRLGLNTDDPGLFDLTLSGELALAQAAMGFTRAELVQVQQLALEASFLPEAQKAPAREALARAYSAMS